MINKEKIIKYIIIFYPLLDIIYSINYRILKINLPINQVARVIIMIFLLSFIRNNKNIFKIVVLLVLLLCGEFYFLYNDSQSLIENISYITKLIMLFVVIYSFEDIYKNSLINNEKIIEWIIYSSVIICISIVLSKFGLGFNSWNNSLRSGVKGLFAVQNTITASLLIIFPLSLAIYIQTKKMRFIYIYILIFISLMFIGTKSGLAGALIILCVQLIFLFIKSKLTYLKAFLSILMIFIIGLFFFISKDIFISFIQEQQKLYLVHNYNNMYSFLISNRDLQITYLERYIHFQKEGEHLLFTGLGYSLANEILGEGKAGYKAIEMDFYGVYYYSGFIVLLLISLVIFRRYIYSIIVYFRNRNYLQMSILLSLSIGIGHAFFGGHVIYEALTILYFGILLASSNYHYLNTKNMK